MAVNKHETRFVLSAQDKTKAALRSAETGLHGLDSMVTKLTIGFGALAGAGGIGLMISRQTEAARAAVAYADALGMSTDKLTAMQFAGESVNIQSEKMSDILKDMSEKISDAYVNKGGEAVEALNNLNLSIEDMAQLSPDQQLLAIADALGNVQTQGAKVQIMESLASDATLLLPLLENSGEEMKRLMQVADDTGKTLTRIEADKLVEVDKAVRDISASLDSLSQTLVVGLSGALIETLKLVNNTTAAINRLGTAITDSIGSEMLDWYERFNKSDIDNSIQHRQKILDKLVKTQLRYEDFVYFGEEKKAERELVLLKAVVRQASRLEEIKSQLWAPMQIDVPPGGGGAVGGSDDGAKEQEKMQAKLERLRQSIITEQQVLAESHLVKQDLITQAEQLGLETEISYNDMRLMAARDHENKMLALTMKGLNAAEKVKMQSYTKQAQFTAGKLQEMTAGIATHSKTAFNINKTASLAMAALNIPEAASNAYAWASKLGGPVAGAAAAALAIAAQIGQMNAIRSQEFGGGGGVGVAPSASLTPAQPVSPVGALNQPASADKTGTQITLYIKGEGAFKDMVIDAFNSANENDELVIINA